MPTALAHDWLTARRGGEAVLIRIAHTLRRMSVAQGSGLPDLTPTLLLTLTDSGLPLDEAVDSIPRAESFLGSIPGARTRLRRWLMPLYPAATRHLSSTLARAHARTPFSLLFSTSSAAMKSLRAPPMIPRAPGAGEVGAPGVARRVPHVCYCHSPARWAWGLTDEYAAAGSPSPTDHLRSLGLRLFAPAFRAWDRSTAHHADVYVANSSHTAAMIRSCYAHLFAPGAAAPPRVAVVFPPVRTEFFTPADGPARANAWNPPEGFRSGFLLAVGQLEPYKRFDLAVLAAARCGTPLVIVGEGTQMSPLRALARASGAAVHFAGRLSDEHLRDAYRAAMMLIFPQVEDFGIVAVEAQACGTPVLARAAGGAIDTVVPLRDPSRPPTGDHFSDASPEAIAAAARTLADAATPEMRRACTLHAHQFSEHRFDTGISHIVHSVFGTS